jgi:hypothetical protein
VKNSLALYQLADVYLADLQVLADLDLDEQTVSDTLEGLSGELEVKATNVAMFCRNLEVSAEAIKLAEGQMANRRKAIENSVKKNPPAVHVEAPELVPAEFMRIPPPPPPVVDKKAVADALKAGQDVPGCRLEHGTRLDIR